MQQTISWSPKEITFLPLLLDIKRAIGAQRLKLLFLTRDRLLNFLVRPCVTAHLRRRHLSWWRITWRVADAITTLLNIAAGLWNVYKLGSYCDDFGYKPYCVYVSYVWVCCLLKRNAIHFRSLWMTIIRHEANTPIIVKTLCNTFMLNSWWRHKMETFSASLVFCAGNSPVNSPDKGQ